MFHLLGLRREERSERDVVGPGITRFHRQVTAVVTSHADLRIPAELFAGLTDIPIILPQMDTIGPDSLGKSNRIIDYESDVVGSAYLLQRFGKARGFVTIEVLYPVLERSDGTGIKGAVQPFRKGASDIERGDQVELAGFAILFGHCDHLAADGRTAKHSGTVQERRRSWDT